MTNSINFIDNQPEVIDWVVVLLYILLVVMVACSALLFHYAWQQGAPQYPQFEKKLSLPTRVQSI